MRSTLAVTTALLLLLGIGVAEAADSTQLAETGGFLLGNAHRCGVPTERVEHAGKVIHGLIVAAAYDSSEAAAADSRFTKIFLASAFPNEGRDPLIPVRGGDYAIRQARATSSASWPELTNRRWKRGFKDSLLSGWHRKIDAIPSYLRTQGPQR